MHVEYRSYKWPQASTDDHEPPHEILHDFYKFDDEIIAFDPRTEQVSTTIMVPMAFADSLCLSDSVKFLKSTSVTCLASISQLCSYNTNLIQQLLNLRLFRQPSKRAESREGSDAFGINIQACKHSFADCTRIIASDQDELEMLSDEVFDEIRMEFLVNGTSVTAASVSFVSNEDLVCGVEEYGPKRVVQKFDVIFKSVAEASPRRIRNVARGYNNLEMISASRLCLVNETVTDGETILDYLKNGTDAEEDFYLKIPTSRKGFCVLTNATFDFLRFNENSLSSCKLALTKNDQLNSTWCEQIKQQIFHHQLSMLRVNFNSTKSYSDLFVSKYWSPRADIASWARVELENFPPTTSETPETENSCSNIASSIRYNFFTSRKRSFKTRRYDYRIERVVIALEGAPQERNFDIDNDNKTAEIALQIQVQFFLLEDMENSSVRSVSKLLMIALIAHFL